MPCSPPRPHRRDEGRVLRISGHVAQNAQWNTVDAGDIQAQTRQVQENIRTVLGSVEGNMSHIAKMTVFVTDMSALVQIHEVRSEFFDPPYPASSLVEVCALVRPKYLIDIEAVAVIPS